MSDQELCRIQTWPNCDLWVDHRFQNFHAMPQTHHPQSKVGWDLRTANHRRHPWRCFCHGLLEMKKREKMHWLYCYTKIKLEKQETHINTLLSNCQPIKRHLNWEVKGFISPRRAESDLSTGSPELGSLGAGVGRAWPHRARWSRSSALHRGRHPEPA